MRALARLGTKPSSALFCALLLMLFGAAVIFFDLQKDQKAVRVVEKTQTTSLFRQTTFVDVPAYHFFITLPEGWRHLKENNSIVAAKSEFELGEASAKNSDRFRISFCPVEDVRCVSQMREEILQDDVRESNDKEPISDTKGTVYLLGSSGERVLEFEVLDTLYQIRAQGGEHGFNSDAVRASVATFRFTNTPPAYLFGELTSLLINNTFDGRLLGEQAFAFSLTASSRSCKGAVSGIAYALPQKDAYRFSVPNCTLNWYVTRDGAEVAEQECSAFHGPSCSFGGIYTPRQTSAQYVSINTLTSNKAREESKEHAWTETEIDLVADFARQLIVHEQQGGIYRSNRPHLLDGEVRAFTADTGTLPINAAFSVKKALGQQGFASLRVAENLRLHGQQLIIPNYAIESWVRLSRGTVQLVTLTTIREAKSEANAKGNSEGNTMNNKARIVLYLFVSEPVVVAELLTPLE